MEQNFSITQLRVNLAFLIKIESFSSKSKLQEDTCFSEVDPGFRTPEFDTKM
jgi:hypothetical protein